jgi:C1A family cysteine protease
MLIVGFVSAGVFIVKNSWSKRWGNGGFCFMSPETIAHKSSNDFWVPTLGTTFQ